MHACACTIAAGPMLPSATVVARSFTAHHPEIPFVTLLADRDGFPRGSAIASPPGLLLTLQELGRPDLMRRAMRYGQQELSYALTAALLQHLLGLGYDAVLFYKQESLICGPQDLALERLTRDSVLLTPHLLRPAEGSDAAVRERTTLLAGAFNLGFVGVANRDPAHRFLRWWDERLDRHCRLDVASGLHYEQRWVELAGSLFDGVGILRAPTFNVGHWNILQRRVTAAPDGNDVRCDGEPCALVRFSGYDAEVPEQMTRYDEGLTAAALGPAAAVVARYRRELLEAGWDSARVAQYGWDVFDDGLPVPPSARTLHDSLPESTAEQLGDPFAIGPGTFRAWLAEAVDGGTPALSRLALHVHGSSLDLQADFPEPVGADRAAFAGWLRAHRSALQIHPALLHDPAPRLGPVAVTVATVDHLPQVRVLAESLHAHHPDLELRALIVDGAPPGFDPTAERFTLLEPWELGVPGLQSLQLSGDVMSVVTRVKPAVLELLLAVGHRSVLYLDADLRVLGDLGPLLEAVGRHPVVLTPHLVGPPEDPPDVDRQRILLQAGTFNGGVVGVSAAPVADEFLAWWSDRLAAALPNDQRQGVFYDQRWLDLAPGLFEGVHVLRDPRFNVGPWNLRQRADVDWRLMHFSGFDPARPQVISRHEPGLRFEDIERARQVYQDYVAALREADRQPGSSSPRPLIGCTVTSADHLAGAIVSATSFVEHHPSSRFVVVVTAKMLDRIDIPDDRIEVRSLTDLPLDGIDSEHLLCTLEPAFAPLVLRPRILRALLHEHDTVLSISPSSLVLAGLDPMVPTEAASSGWTIAQTRLTPTPFDDGREPGRDEWARLPLLAAECMGFDRRAARFLDWWGARAYEEPRFHAVSGPLIVDAWIDIGVATFDAQVVHDPGVCAAYSDRTATVVPSDVTRVDVMHQALADLAPVLREVLRFDTVAALRAGSRLPATPHDAEGFRAWLQSSDDTPADLPLAVYALWCAREDLQIAYPDPSDASHREDLLRWAQEEGPREYPLVDWDTIAAAGTSG